MASLSLTTIANAAAQYLGVLDSGESLSAQQITDALAAMNNLLDNWSSEQLMLLQVVRSTENLTQGVQSYGIGSGQIWNLARPVAIAGASLINSFGPGGPMEVVNAAKWTSIPDRQAQSYLPRFLFYDRGYPTGTVYVSPVPLGAALSVELITWSPLTQFADATTAVTMLPGYSRVLELALAMELAPQYDVAPTPALIQNYSDAIARVRNLNAELTGREAPAGQVAANTPQGGAVAPNEGAQ